MAVNAMGDVYEEGTIIAGMLTETAGKKTGGKEDSQALFANTSRCLLESVAGRLPPPGQNTTIGVIASNGSFSKVQCNKIAAMGHNGMARAIRPVHTSFDGDILYALAAGDIKASVDVAGEMAAIVVERAIIKAVKAAAPAGSLPSWQSFNTL